MEMRSGHPAEKPLAGQPDGRAPSAGAAAGERRDEIIDAARSLYEEKGLSRTTIQDITARVGVTRSLFYHYFPNKDAVTSAVLDTYVADFVEAARYWDEGRREGQIDESLASVVKLLRMGLFERGSFRRALASNENAELYLEFVNRVAERIASFMEEHTVKDYQARHQIRIQHVHETFYVLVLGLVGYLRSHPDADDALVADLIAQTLHLDR